MSLIWAEGFNVHASVTALQSRYPTSSFDSLADFRAGRWVGRGFYGGLGGSSFRTPVLDASVGVSDQDTVQVTMNVYPLKQSASQATLLTIRDGGSDQIHFDLKFDGLGNWRIVTFRGATQLTETDDELVEHWHNVVFSIEMNTSSGSADVQINGLGASNFSGNTGADSYDVVEFHASHWIVDDLTVWDEVSGGNDRFYFVEEMATKANEKVAWTTVGSLTNNYEAVNDEGAADDSTLVETDVADAADVYKWTDLILGASSDYPLQEARISARVQLDSAGSENFQFQKKDKSTGTQSGVGVFEPVSWTSWQEIGRAFSEDPGLFHWGFDKA